MEQTITNLNNSIAHFGTQEQQIQQAENIADTLVNFKSRYSELGNTYSSITTALSKVPNAQSLQNVVSKKNNPYSPQGIETNYYLNQNSYNQIQTINQELGRNPFRKLGIVSSQTNNGAMNGIGIQVGYKQFFTKKENGALGITASLITTMRSSNPAFSTRLLMYGLMVLERTLSITSSTIKPPIS